MFSIIGIVVVFGAVIAGYLMEHGNMKVLMQPAELIIILGAAIGTVLVANPLHILTKIGKGVVGAFTGSPFTKQWYGYYEPRQVDFANEPGWLYLAMQFPGLADLDMARFTFSLDDYAREVGELVATVFAGRGAN
jgi:Motility protein A N-terminal